MTSKTIPHESVLNRPFTVVQNAILEDFTISPLARLLLIYHIKYANLPEWVFHNSVLKEWMKCGRGKLEALFAELKEAGYIIYLANKNKDGKFTGKTRMFSDAPIFRASAEPSILGASGNRSIRKSSDIERTDSLKKKERLESSTDSELGSTQTVTSEGDTTEIELVKELGSIGITKNMGNLLIARHGHQKIAAGIEVTRRSATTNPAGFLNAWIAARAGVPWVGPEEETYESKERRRITKASKDAEKLFVGGI